MNKALLVFAGKTVSFTINPEIETAISLAEGLLTIDEKAKKFDLSYFFKKELQQAKLDFETAQNYESIGEHKNFLKKIQETKESFKRVALHLDSLEKVYALIMTGLCCQCLGNIAEKRTYYNKAIKEIEILEENDALEGKNHVIAATLAGSLVGTGTGGFLAGWGFWETFKNLSFLIANGLGINQFWVWIGIAAEAPLAIMGFVVGAVTIGTLTFFLKGNILDKKFDSLNYTVGELKEALKEGVIPNSAILVATS